MPLEASKNASKKLFLPHFTFTFTLRFSVFHAGFHPRNGGGPAHSDPLAPQMQRFFASPGGPLHRDLATLAGLESRALRLLLSVRFVVWVWWLQLPAKTVFLVASTVFTLIGLSFVLCPVRESSVLVCL